MAAYTTIDDPSLFFDILTYTGNMSTDRDITGLDFQPDFVWVKNRSTTNYHNLKDSVRGTSVVLFANNTDAEISDSDRVTAFLSNGFTVSNSGDTNGSGNSIVAWCWKESATSGFDIVSYTGTGSATTISHGLGSIPQVYFLKNRSSSAGWTSYFEPLGNTKFLQLDSTGAAGTATEAFNDTSPTSSVFSIGSDTSTNNNTDNFVAYLWTSKQGFSKVGGSYTGNGNADGTFVYTGFRPAWLLLKQSSASGENWLVFDNKRLGYNVDNNSFNASADSAEATGDYLDLLSNGFKIRSTNSVINGSGATYIFMAFAEAPFVNSNGVPCNAR